ncbi:GNAT family N-acetyltransferase [Zobellia sp. B3R18]|uniref:GNAT family N-acetyltransferase n=1 Tax=Zobellia sp. B3R18 TaxID=2841568 RepID=UPI001C06E1B6|nr:GNAT family N-acetyltransferase [Zobellia sp. B3R18]MBU2975239.1 GNAT family N-acetyltransferase [Zobellia sp. B3R18]
MAKSKLKVITTTVTTDSELKQILALQKKNLSSTLSPKEKALEGFVTVEHTFEVLKAMNDVCPHIIAKSGSLVVGYALCMHPKFADEIQVLKPMFTQIESVIPKPENYMVMGQICIDKAFRKQGIFRKLYETMQTETRENFNSIITEVDATNTRSLIAHYAIGFNELQTYESAGQKWVIVLLQ